MDEVIAQKNEGKPIKVVANLPYYITTPIVMGLLEKRLPVESITIMIQKEVADRMQAKPSTKDYGTLSLAVQYYCTPKIVAVAPAHCFMPQPNVDSSVIQLKVLEHPSVSVTDEQLLFKLIKVGFSQRRKTLMNCLNNSPEIKLSKEDIVSSIVEAGLDERIRGEALSLSDFAKLTDILAPKIS
jgi:16S rRNA (adenine1518-N6/adenine1519-N6)-dimethyltransferase